MRVAAPGKLLLAGAYAVLEGAPALVVAVDRVAVADGDAVSPRPTPEVLAAIARDQAPAVDASQLRQGDFKLGLGSSAAMLVASLGVVHARAGADLRSAGVRDALFEQAWRAHAEVQQGGSGLDVAASVYGGVVEYALEGPSHAPRARVTPARLPTALRLDVFWCGVPAVTTGMRARVDALRGRDAAAHVALLGAIATASRRALAAGRADDVPAFVAASREGANALAALGHAADAPIFPPQTLPLARLAEADGAAFLPSGAGGGDVFVHVGLGAASPSFVAAAAAAGLVPVPMRVHTAGVHLLP